IYSNNPLDVNITLYDNDGVTQLAQVEVFNGFNPATGILNVDRLAAGTYYLKVQPYTTAEFAVYTLTDSLLTYNTNDIEPDDNPYQASTIPANDSVTGHVGFYFNGGVKSDLGDWFKINYTGTGNLQFTLRLLPHLGNGALGDVIFQVYRDTAAAPVFSQEFYTSSLNIFTIGSLAQGTYWIKIKPYSESPGYFSAYSISRIPAPVSWIGVTSTSWTTATNWAFGIVPTLTDNVIIPAGTPFSPIIASGVVGLCKSIKVNTGAVVTIATGGNLKIGP
ncbi:MAG: hypothetical protein ABI707_11450, partial [Ferruginibacter sp.]